MFQSLIAQIARALESAGIQYMIIGGQAVLVYGEPRLTRDIDITLGVDSSGLGRVLDVVRELGLKPAVKDAEDFVRETNVLPVSQTSSGIRINFIFSFTEYERTALGRTAAIDMDKTTVRFAAVEDLIIHKLVAGRPRDIEDVRGIIARKPALDETYLRQWLDSFSATLERDLSAQLADMQQR